MIQIIRPIPNHLDARDVQRMAAMGREAVRDCLDHHVLLRRQVTDRDDRDRADRNIEAARFVLSECEAPETRMARERAAMDRLQYHIDQHTAILADLTSRMREHAMALDELCLLAQRAEVAA